jgi:hypothetical protein
MATQEAPAVVGEEPGERRRDRLAATVPFHRWLLAASLVALNLLDVLVTKWILALGGEERNPLMRPIIEHSATPILVKLGIALIVGVLVLSAPQRSRFTDIAVSATVVFYAAVVGWNVAVVLQSAPVT